MSKLKKVFLDVFPRSSSRGGLMWYARVSDGVEGIHCLRYIATLLVLLHLPQCVLYSASIHFFIDHLLPKGCIAQIGCTVQVISFAWKVHRYLWFYRMAIKVDNLSILDKLVLQKIRVCWYFWYYIIIFSCPEQLNRTHCPSLGLSVTTNNQSLHNITEWP